MDKVRVDKWLWSVRIFKTRSLATDMVKKGRVSIDGKSIKPSYLLKVGETLEVKKDGFNLILLVKELLEKRVSATLAAPCYDNLTPEDELNKYRDWFEGKGHAEIRQKGTGRPTKRERRDIDQYKDDFFLFESDED